LAKLKQVCHDPEETANFKAGIGKKEEVKIMKKLGRKLNVTNETLRAYCGCACITGCTIKCSCSPTGTVNMASNLYNTSVANVYSTGGTSLK
jgi:putative bacteriocin precursor